MKIKDGVYTQITVIINGTEEVVRMSNAIRAAMVICDNVSKRVAGKGVVVTSILDGKHKDGSKHYVGEAFDLRSFIYTKDEIAWLEKEFKNALGTDYDVIYETDHFHVEHDPK